MTDAPPPIWWAVEITAPDGSTSVDLCQTEPGLAALIAERAATMAEARIVTVEPEALARLRLAHDAHRRRPDLDLDPPVGPPTTAAEVLADMDTSSWPVTAEQAADWPRLEWGAFLDRAMITESEACRELARVVGHPVNLTDIKGHPERAAVLLALAARDPRKKAS